MSNKTEVDTVLELVDWRRQVGDLYRLTGDDAMEQFRKKRNQLFKTHPQTPIMAEELAQFESLEYFEPNPEYRVKAQMVPDSGEIVTITTAGKDGDIRYSKVGKLLFELEGIACSLAVLSLQQYGGGLFVPFKDATSGTETYGGGRYLFDTAKNTDGLAFELLENNEVILDFNYAYNPSCVYNPAWSCPLAPLENTLPLAVTAGEKMYQHPEV